MQRFFGLVSMGLFIALTAAAQFEFGMAGPQVSYEAAVETGAVQPGDAFRGAMQFTLSQGWHVNAHEPLEDYLIPTVLRFEDRDGFSLQGVAYPEHKLFTFAFSPEPLAVYEEVFVLGFTIAVDEAVEPGDYVLEGVLRYQACNDRMCAPPRDLAVTLPVTVASADAALEKEAPQWFASAAWPRLADAVPAEEGPEGESVIEEEAPPVEAAAAPDVNWRELVDRFEITGVLAGFSQKQGFLDFLDASAEGLQEPVTGGDRRWWWMILVVLGGGILLNLTPCVLPLIPINVAIIGAGARAGSRVRGFALGSAYGLGIAAVYGALGLVVVLGLSTAFGTLNSTPWFNAAIAVLFVVLALAMFDIIQIDFSRFQAKLGMHGGGKGHFFAALGMGAVSALLAGACVAPVVIYTILQAQDLYSQGSVFALALPFGLGVGMALPWPFLGAGLSFLPKPGKWMERVKQGFGVFILLFAAYYGHMAYTLAQPHTVDIEDDGVWVHSLDVGLARALEENRPVLIDFWATWCKNCLVMDRTVLRDEEVLDRLENHVKIKYQAEVLSESPVKDVVEYFQVLGLPTFIVLEPKG